MFNFIQKVVITDIMFDRKSLSIAVVLIDLDNRSFEWGNAGLEHLQYITRKDGQIMTTYLEADNGPFGMENNAILVQKMPYEPGAILVGYSDGVVDIRNKKDDRLNEDGFEAIKNEALLHHDACYILPAILEKLWDFRGDAEQADDITMVLVEFK